MESLHQRRAKMWQELVKAVAEAILNVNPDELEVEESSPDQVRMRTPDNTVFICS